MNNSQFFFNKTFYNNSKSKYFSNSFLPFLELFETPSFCNTRKNKRVLSKPVYASHQFPSFCLTPLANSALVSVDSQVFGTVQHLPINNPEVI